MEVGSAVADSAKATFKQIEGMARDRHNGRKKDRFIGLGHMGGSMAARFLAGGYVVSCSTCLTRPGSTSA